MLRSLVFFKDYSCLFLQYNLPTEAIDSEYNYSETCTNGHLCKTDTSLLQTFYLSPFIFHYILCLKYTCYYGHLSNAYNGQLICAQEALIRLNEPV